MHILFKTAEYKGKENPESSAIRGFFFLIQRSKDKSHSRLLIRRRNVKRNTYKLENRNAERRRNLSTQISISYKENIFPVKNGIEV